MTTLSVPTYPDPKNLEYLRVQSELFEENRVHLLQDYGNQYIAFENGAVLDHDTGESRLVERVYKKYGYRPILIKQVLDQEPHLTVGGSFTRHGI